MSKCWGVPALLVYPIIHDHIEIKVIKEYTPKQLDGHPTPRKSFLAVFFYQICIVHAHRVLFSSFWSNFRCRRYIQQPRFPKSRAIIWQSDDVFTLLSLIIWPWTFVIHRCHLVLCDQILYQIEAKSNSYTDLKFVGGPHLEFHGRWISIFACPPRTMTHPHSGFKRNQTVHDGAIAT